MNPPNLTTKRAGFPVRVVAPPRVVAAVYSAASLAAARSLGPAPAAPDWLELRVDHFHGRPADLDGLVARAPRPLVVTVRHPREGGATGAPTATTARRRLYERFVDHPTVTAMDVEVRSLRSLAGLVRGARGIGRCVVVSHHDFQGVPPPARLHALAARAVDAGADIFKLAATVARPGQLARLLDFMEWGDKHRVALAVMGMGPLGRVSRLALAAAGSVLNYGYLGEDGPQVPGQWPAAQLRERIQECTPEADGNP